MGVAGTVTRGAGEGELPRSRRVLLVSESAGLAAVLVRLLDREDRLSRLGSLGELAGGSALATADAVVLDVPAADRGALLERLRRHYQGALVVLVARGDDGGDLPPDETRTLLARPFSAEELSAALTTAEALAVGHGDPVEPPAPPLDVEAMAEDPWAQPRRRSRLLPLLIRLAQAWRSRRRVRVAGFVSLAAVAFVVAFALAAQGRCGPGCDLLGTGVAPAPTIPADSPAPTATVKRRAPASTGATVGGSGEVRGRSGTVLGPTSTAARGLPTTTRASGGATTTRPPTTRPTTTPTTQPPTTPTTTAEPTTTPPTTAGF